MVGKIMHKKISPLVLAGFGAALAFGLSGCVVPVSEPMYRQGHYHQRTYHENSYAPSYYATPQPVYRQETYVTTRPSYGAYRDYRGHDRYSSYGGHSIGWDYWDPVPRLPRYATPVVVGGQGCWYSSGHYYRQHSGGYVRFKPSNVSISFSGTFRR